MEGKACSRKIAGILFSEYEPLNKYCYYLLLDTSQLIQGPGKKQKQKQKCLHCGTSKKPNRTLIHEIEGSHFDLLTGCDRFSCRGPGTGTNYEKRVNGIPFRNSNRENQATFLDFPLFLGIFQWHEPTKGVPFTAEPAKFRKF